VRDILTSRENAEIVRAIVSLAASLDLRVIAEGVETREQLEALARLGCEHFQGFYCCPPVASAQLGARIAAWERGRRASAARPGSVQGLESAAALQMLEAAAAAAVEAEESPGAEHMAGIFEARR
jgi:predicted signal transduction protein with EAL and GGDEF domain